MSKYLHSRLISVLHLRCFVLSVANGFKILNMIERVLVPQAFENMEEATLGAWRRREGDALAFNEPLCELITEKTTFDLPFEIQGSGLALLHIAAPEKSILPVHAVLALVGPADASRDELQSEIEAAARDNKALLQKRASATPEAAPALSVPVLSVPSLAAPSATTPNAARTTASAAGGTRVRATPAARRAAKELGLEIEAVAAKLPGKVLSEDDVRAFSAS